MCPDLTAFVQVGVCPSEEELRFTYTGYCGDNARMYNKSDDFCDDYESYRAFKNTSLWETADGRFGGYLACDRAINTAQAVASQVVVSKQGTVTRVACQYPGGVVMSYRTKATCVVAPDACSQGTCRTECE